MWSGHHVPDQLRRPGPAIRECRYLGDRTRKHREHISCSRCPFVGLTLAYSNPNPQLDGLLKRLSGPLPARAANPGPSYNPEPESDDVVETSYGRPPRPLNQRLSSDARAELVAAFASGIKQKDLAHEYGVSVRSVKRLVQQARNTKPAHTGE